MNNNKVHGDVFSFCGLMNPAGQKEGNVIRSRLLQL